MDRGDGMDGVMSHPKEMQKDRKSQWKEAKGQRKEGGKSEMKVVRI